MRHSGAPLRLAAHRHTPDLVPVCARGARVVDLQLHRRSLQPRHVQSWDCARALAVLHLPLLQGVGPQWLDFARRGSSVYHR